MDTLTHALSGALAARATALGGPLPRGAVPRRVAAGFFASASPDLDFVIGFLGPLEYLQQHRGPTHSVLLLPLWALLCSWMLAKLLREPGGWRALYGVTALGIGTHIAGDLMTSFGTIVFAPLWDWRAAIGTTFIIDLWFSGIILAGLVASAVWRRSRIPAHVATAVLVGYVGFQALLKQQALDFAAQSAAERGMQNAALRAEPRPVSPFNWTVFVSDERAHHFAHVNLVRREPRVAAPDAGFVARLDAAYLPLAQARWETRARYGAQPAAEALAQDAWNSPALEVFRWFAALPAFDGITEGSTCVWFRDLRFEAPARGDSPFRYGACRETRGGAWRAYQRRGETGRIALD
jgi:inner membrane protein